jgi:aminoglycoside phosphotransferase (APT) family kinase protein
MPIPPLYWSEPDSGSFGAPFFIMGRVEGQVPPDIMPYNFRSGLRDAPEADQL